MKKLSIIVVSLLVSSFMFTSCKKETIVVNESNNYLEFNLIVTDTSTPIYFNTNSLSKNEKYFVDFGDNKKDSFSSNIGGDYHKYSALGLYTIKFYFNQNSKTTHFIFGDVFQNSDTYVPKNYLVSINKNDFSFLQNLTDLLLSNNKITNVPQITLPNDLEKLIMNGNALTTNDIDNLILSVASINQLKNNGMIRLDYQKPQSKNSINVIGSINAIKSKNWVINIDY